MRSAPLCAGLVSCRACGAGLVAAASQAGVCELTRESVAVRPAFAADGRRLGDQISIISGSEFTADVADPIRTVTKLGSANDSLCRRSHESGKTCTAWHGAVQLFTGCTHLHAALRIFRLPLSRLLPDRLPLCSRPAPQFLSSLQCFTTSVCGCPIRAVCCQRMLCCWHSTSGAARPVRRHDSGEQRSISPRDVVLGGRLFPHVIQPLRESIAVKARRPPELCLMVARAPEGVHNSC